jgi:IclR family acetate operon transcriptional repressor
MPHRQSLPARRGRTPSKPDSGTTTSHVQSLTRGLTILERLSELEGGATLTDVAQRVGLAASTTHRLLNTLEKMGYVHQSGELGLWTIGITAFTVGSAFISNRDFAIQSHGYLRRLMEQSGETANLSILDGFDVVFIGQVQCREIMRMIVKLGSRHPIHASGSGKAILAALPDDTIQDLLAKHGLPRHTEHTIVTPDGLWNAIKLIRKHGYAYDDEEHALGLRCVAAAVYDEYAEPLGAISLAGPLSRLTDERIRALGPLVARTAAEITARMGGRWPHPY